MNLILVVEWGFVEDEISHIRSLIVEPFYWSWFILFVGAEYGEGILVKKRYCGFPLFSSHVNKVSECL